MKKKYNSLFFPWPIEVESVLWDKIVFITSDKWEKVIYSWYNLDKKQSDIVYINKCLLWWFIKKIPKSALILGFWAWSFAKYLEDHIDDINITWVDIDNSMLEIAKKEFEVRSTDLLCIDAKNAVSKLLKENKKYDLILIDCYGIDSEIPKHLTSCIFFDNCKKLLSNNWTVSVNMANFIIDENKENKDRIEKYREMHQNLKYVFWEYFVAFTHGDWIWENIVWIYNLDKYYSSKEIVNNYMEKVENNKIIYDYNIVLNTFVDEGRVFLW